MGKVYLVVSSAQLLFDILLSSSCERGEGRPAHCSADQSRLWGARMDGSRRYVLPKGLKLVHLENVAMLLEIMGRVCKC